MDVKHHVYLLAASLGLRWKWRPWIIQYYLEHHSNFYESTPAALCMCSREFSKHFGLSFTSLTSFHRRRSGRSDQSVPAEIWSIRRCRVSCELNTGEEPAKLKLRGSAEEEAGRRRRKRRRRKRNDSERSCYVLSLTSSGQSVHVKNPRISIGSHTIVWDLREYCAHCR